MLGDEANEPDCDHTNKDVEGVFCEEKEKGGGDEKGGGGRGGLWMGDTLCLKKPQPCESGELKV